MDIFSTNQNFQMGLCQTDKGGSFGPVYQSHLAIWIVLKGKTTAVVDGQSFQVKHGQAGFFYAHTVHKLQYDSSEVSYLWCSNALNPDAGFVALKESIKQLVPFQFNCDWLSFS